MRFSQPLSLFCIFGCLIGCQVSRSTKAPDKTTFRVELLQTVAQFDRPESLTADLEGRHVFVSNCASGVYGADELFGLAREGGAISKLRIEADGTLKMLEPRFVEGITAPLGISPLPVATERFPKGALFVNTGFFMQIDKDNRHVTDTAALGTGVTVLCPETGAVLGHLSLGIGGVVANRIGTDFNVPNGLAFDDQGNLYVAETGAENTISRPATKSEGGVLRIAHQAIDAIATGVDHPDVRFVPLKGVNGVMYDAEADAILAVTCQGFSKEPFSYGVYHIAARDFGKGSPTPIAVDLPAMDNIVRTAAGLYICSTMAGGLLAVNPASGESWPIELPGGISLESPADIKLLNHAPSGKAILLVPEQEHLNPERWKQRVRVFEAID